jgi:hypothetical protein
VSLLDPRDNLFLTAIFCIQKGFDIGLMEVYNDYHHLRLSGVGHCLNFYNYVLRFDQCQI